MMRAMSLGIDAPTRKGTAISRDGTRIAYHVIGDGPRVWLMPPAMGAPLVSMKPLIQQFSRDYTIVSWDNRGFYGSGDPPHAEAMRVEDHLDDMEAVVAAEQLERFVLGGWSMAVQLSLEYTHRHPDRVRALVLINGPYERALSSVARVPGSEALLVAALRAAASAGRVLNPLSRRYLGAGGAGKLLLRAGVIAANPTFVDEILKDFSQLDWGRYFTMTRLLHDHSAAAYLPKIRVPTLITTGTHDLVTPPPVAERLHAAIAGSELYVVPRATHYVVAEFPQLLGARIAEFLTRVEGVDIR
jgi:pimeloyl-ACP methyl ester carboxylesterase